jgi:hypothetical protein
MTIMYFSRSNGPYLLWDFEALDFVFAYPILPLYIYRTINMTHEIFLKSDDSCPLWNICCLHFPSTLLDPTVGILSEVFLGSDDSCPLRDFILLVILLVLNPFLPRWSTTKLTTVDLTVPLFYSRSRLILNSRSNIDLMAEKHPEAPTSKMMVLLYGLLYSSTQLDPTVENSLGLDQRSGMIAGSQLSQHLKLLSSSPMEISHW